MTLLVSMTVGNSSNRTLHTICESLAIPSSLMLDGRLSTLVNYSALLSKIASLSVMIRMFPITLINVVAPDLFGP